ARWEHVRAPSDAQRTKAQEEFPKVVASAGKSGMPFPLLAEASDSTPWERKGDTLRLLYPCLLLLVFDAKTAGERAVAGTLPVETSNPDAEVPVWRIAPLQIERVIVMPPTPPGGRRPGM